MSNTLEKKFIETVSLTETEPSYTWGPVGTIGYLPGSGQSWVPGTTTTTYQYWGYNSNGTKVYTDLLDTGIMFFEGSKQVDGTASSFSYLGSNGWETIKVLGQEPITTTTAGYFNLSQPSTTSSVAVITKDPNLGWNSSARSIDTILGDGTASFTAKIDETGAIVGLNELYDSMGSDYFEISFAIYLKDGYYKISEQGNFKTAFLPYIATDSFSISRIGSSIYYAKNNVVFYKSLSSSTEELLLDTSLYAGGDAIYNASIVSTSLIDLRTASLSNTSSILLATPKATTYLYIVSAFFVLYVSDGDGVHTTASLSSTSSLMVSKMFGTTSLSGTSTLVSSGHHVTEMSGSLGSMTASLSSGYFNYGSLIGSFSPMTAKLAIGAVTNTFTYINASFVPMSATGISFVGQTTTPMIMELPSMTALLADKEYAAISGTLQSLNAYAVQYPPDERDVGNNALVKEYAETFEDLRYSQLSKIVEQLLIVLNTTSSISVDELLNDYLNILDSILLEFKGTISESIALASTLTTVLSNIELLTSSMSIDDTFITVGTLHNQLISLIGILEEFGYRSVESISETIVISDVLTSLYKSLGVLLETLGLAGTLGGTHIHILSIVDPVILSSVLSDNSIFNSGILDSFVISIPTAKGSDKYLAYLLSPETNSISNYDNYNFDGCTKFNNKYLFYNSTGLYEYGGNLDDTSIIRSKIETVAYNFGTSNLKQVPAIYLGMNSSGATYVKVRVDGKADVTYKLNKKTVGLQTQKIDIGKGLVGRYFQFEIITDSLDFNMESIDFFPLVLRRKL